VKPDKRFNGRATGTPHGRPGQAGQMSSKQFMA
jgi:hypothetical protein